jgi:hypothetical protein
MQRFLDRAVAHVAQEERARLQQLRRQAREQMLWYHAHEAELESLCARLGEYEEVEEFLGHENADLHARIAKLRSQRLQREKEAAEAAAAAAPSPAVELSSGLASSSLAQLRPLLARKRDTLAAKITQFRELRDKLAQKRSAVAAARSLYDERLLRAREHVREELEVLVAEAQDIQVCRAEVKAELASHRRQREEIAAVLESLLAQAQKLSALTSSMVEAIDTQRNDATKLLLLRDDIHHATEAATRAAEDRCADIHAKYSASIRRLVGGLGRDQLGVTAAIGCNRCFEPKMHSILHIQSGEVLCRECAREYDAVGSGERRKQRSLTIPSEENDSDENPTEDVSMYNDNYDALVNNPYLSIFLAQPAADDHDVQDSDRTDELPVYEPYVPDHVPLPVMNHLLSKYQTFETSLHDNLAEMTLTVGLLNTTVTAIRKAKESYQQQK